ncbi:hypothetical protein FYJ85_02395 [Victivallaceae bacterium BBE-744-WT-12]|jgi:hypothetical protein|uniref:CT398-like coiled coil hairpin domain-containing protein n=1 Tax=Victivallis lenta TaxID=2606640 RepID=A0A844FYD2_9BACT|nr:hypothetical protein [Victivallis lenta]MBS5530927.1 hypothetical protein [bacterium]MST95893.1 hypothetical protein [Victivallis lenta]
MAARWAEALLKLQRVDLKIRELEARLALLPKEMTELKNKRDAAVAEVNAAASAAKKIELERKGVESEIEKLNAENKRLQQQSAMVKKNTEYQAMLGTIALNEKKVGDLESRELELMDRFEEARKAYRKIRQDNEAAVNAIRAEFDELVAFAGDLKKEIAQLKEERPADIRGVDGETLARYNRLLAGKDGIAPLVRVENEICGSCHLRVTRQALTNMQKGAVTSCENCMHFIYLEDVE